MKINKVQPSNTVLLTTILSKKQNDSDANMNESTVISTGKFISCFITLLYKNRTIQKAKRLKLISPLL